MDFITCNQIKIGKIGWLPIIFIKLRKGWTDQKFSITYVQSKKGNGKIPDKMSFKDIDLDDLNGIVNARIYLVSDPVNAGFSSLPNVKFTNREEIPLPQKLIYCGYMYGSQFYY